MSIFDRKFWGEEPKISINSNCLELINAYNWLNYLYSVDDAKHFVLEYLQERNMPDSLIDNISDVSSMKLINVGWNCKLLLSGNKLPIDIDSKMWHKIHTLASAEGYKKSNIIPIVASTRTNTNKKAEHVISELEEQLDVITNTGHTSFDVEEFFRTYGLTPHVAKNVIDYYKPIYGEVYDVQNTNDAELKYAYRYWKKKDLKKCQEFLNKIVGTAEVYCIKTVKPRKQRKKKKIKPASVQISKVQYKNEDVTYKVKSISPTDIVGSTQIWLFNTKYRTLTVLNANGSSGLSVKGTTIGSFDEKTSSTKILRKPENTLSSVRDFGKVQLRKLMDNIKGKTKTATGRINSDTIILRSIK